MRFLYRKIVAKATRALSIRIPNIPQVDWKVPFTSIPRALKGCSPVVSIKYPIGKHIAAISNTVTINKYKL